MDAVRKDRCSFEGSEEDLSVRSKQRTVPFGIGNLAGRGATFEGCNPQPALTSAVECRYHHLSTVRRDIVSQSRWSHDTKTRQQGLVPPGIQLHHPQLAGIG